LYWRESVAFTGHGIQCVDTGHNDATAHTGRPWFTQTPLCAAPSMGWPHQPTGNRCRPTRILQRVGLSDYRLWPNPQFARRGTAARAAGEIGPTARPGNGQAIH